MAAGLVLLAGCKDDNESNPTITQPSQFVLNEPAVKDNVDLQKSSTVSLTWSQPTPYNNFNAPVVPTYSVQVSPSGSFNQAFDADLEDNTGADYFELAETYSNGLKAEISTETLKNSWAGRMSLPYLPHSSWPSVSSLPSATLLSRSTTSSTQTSSI